MNTRLGNILYWAGITGAAISILYIIDVIWVHENGRSLLPVPARFVSREEMLINVGIGVVLALAFWGAGSAARYIVHKAAEKRPASK